MDMDGLNTLIHGTFIFKLYSANNWFSAPIRRCLVEKFLIFNRPALRLLSTKSFIGIVVIRLSDTLLSYDEK